MKNIIKTIVIALMVSITNSCDKELDIISSFDFDIIENHTEDIIIGVQELTEIDIIPEVVVTTNIYSMRYNVTSGDGIYQTEDGINLPEGEWFDLESLNVVLNYISSEVGENNVTISVKDLSERAPEEIELVYNVEHNPFIWEANSSLPQVFVGDTISSNLILDNIGPDQSVTYLSRIFFTQGEGEIIATDENGESTDPIEQNENFNINEGLEIYNITFFQSGENKIIYEAIDSNGQVKRDSLIYNVNTLPDNDFTFSATSSSNDASVNANVPINFNITETVSSSETTYSMIFTSSTSGNFTFNNTSYSQGESIPVEPGNFVGQFMSEESGENDIEFIVTNSDQIPLSRNDNVTINFTELGYTLSTAGGGPLLINEIDEFFTVITQEVQNPNITYQVRFSIQNGSTGSGNVLDSGGIQIPLSTFIPSNIGSTTYQFQGTNEGTISILVEAIDSNGVERESVIDFQVNTLPPSDFTFTAISSANEALVDTNVPVNFIITETQGSSTYNMVFTSSTTGELSLNGVSYLQGELIPVQAGNFVGQFTSSIAGQNDISFTVTNTNSTPLSRTDDITINYTQIGFTLSTAGEGSLLLNTTREFFTIITQEGTDPTINYQVRFSIQNGSTGSGNVLDAEGTQIPLSTFIDVNTGSTLFNFEGTNLGNVDLLVEAIDSNGVERQAVLNFEVTGISFTFSATEQDGSIIIGESTGVFFNVTENGPSGTNYEISYEITSANTANLLNAGESISPNTFIPISIGSSSWTFESVEIGNINVSFTVRNTSTLETQSDNISVSVTNPPVSTFTFTAIPEENSIGINNCVPVNFNINEVNGSGAPYSMVFTSSGTGTFIIGTGFGAITYQQGETIPIEFDADGNFVGCYRGTTEGNHNVNFTLENSNTPSISMTEPISVEFVAPLDPDFTFIAIPTQNSGSEGQCIDINFDVTETNGSGQPYTMIFTTSQTGTVTTAQGTFSQGQQIPIILDSNGNFIACYTGITPGNHNVSFTLENSNIPAISRSENVNITFDPLTFDFDVQTTLTNQIVGNPVTQNATYSQQTNFTQTLTFNSNFSGNVVYNGVTFNENQNIPIQNSDLLAGQWNFQYIGNIEGTHNIQYTLTSNTGLSETSNVTIVYERDCTITVPGLGNWFDSGQPLPNNTHLWDSGRDIIGSEFQVMSQCDDTITLTLSVVSQTSSLLPTIGAQILINSDVNEPFSVLPLDTPIELPRNQNHALRLDTTTLQSGTVSGNRVIRYTITNGVDTVTHDFVQVFAIN